MRRNLCDLPTCLGRAYPVDTEPPHDESCIVCLRPFNTVDDPTDPKEEPCRPLQQNQCRHLIGSKCYDELFQRGLTNCPLCREQLVHPLPRWLAYLFSSEPDHCWPGPLKYFWQLPGYMAMSANNEALYSNPVVQKAYEVLLIDLLLGTATWKDGWELWKYYVWFLVTDGQAILCQLEYIMMFFSYWGAEIGLECLFGVKMFPQVIYEVGGIDVGSFCVFVAIMALGDISRIHALNGWLTVVIEAYGIRWWAKAARLRYFLLFLLGEVLAYIVLVAVMIGMGVGYGKKFQTPLALAEKRDLGAEWERTQARDRKKRRAAAARRRAREAGQRLADAEELAWDSEDSGT